ncbi:hypothetical protein CDL60_08050 [Roseateles noduli]|nr:hypothetical protein CDL60_08050 [Roseateles noduli]
MTLVARRTGAGLLLAAALAAPGAAAGAQFIAYAEANSRTGTRSLQDGGVPQVGASFIAVSADARLLDTSSSLIQNAEAVSAATATFGHLTFVARTAATQTSVSGAQPGTRGESMASAEAIDSFVVRCATCVDGTRGLMNFRVVLEGDVGMAHASTDLNGQATAGPAREMQYFWTANLSMRAEGVGTEFPGPGVLSLYAYDYLAKVNDTVAAGGSREGLGVYDLQLEFEFGRPISMDWQGLASASSFLHDEAGGPGFLSAQSFSAFTHSFYWDGISSVTDANGNAVSGFSALNSVGVNYVQSFADVVVAVPEPGTWTLMALGLAVLAAFTRRGRGRTAP